MSKTIPLTQGKEAIVDDEDCDWLSRWKWYANKINGIYYVMRNLPLFQGKRTTVYMHRALLRADPGEDIDHVNHDGLDNRRCNLRICSRAENMQNQQPRTDGTSQHKGVCWDKGRGKWRASIRIGSRHIHLGRFGDELDAAKAYNEAAVKHYGEFACLNEAAPAPQ